MKLLSIRWRVAATRTSCWTVTCTLLFFNSRGAAGNDNPAALFSLGPLAGGDSLADIVGRRCEAQELWNWQSAKDGDWLNGHCPWVHSKGQVAG